MRRVRSTGPRFTAELARAAATDAANCHMRAAGRKRWNREDLECCVRTFDRLWPEEKDRGSRELPRV